MHSEVDLNKYYSLKEIEGYELFIGPEGEYYKVKKINENSTISHSVWATEYFKRNNFNEPKDNSSFDSINTIINKHGFVRYAHAFSPNPIIDVPNPTYYGVRVTNLQIEAIYNLLNHNLEYLTEEQERLLCEEINILDTMSDKVFRKIINISV